MRPYLSFLFFVLFGLSGFVLGQSPGPPALVPNSASIVPNLLPQALSPSDITGMDAAMDGVLNSILASEDSFPPKLAPPPVLPVMSPDLALLTYQSRAAQQAAGLASYTSTSVIRAELPESKQQGEYEVKRQYSAPKSLLFTALRFTGDTFVKSNVITRLMQSEVEHVEKDDSSSMAFNAANYKFSYKGLQNLGGRTLHEFQVKPRRRRVGLLKGNLYLDAYTGSLVHLEGVPAKSPSVFLSKIRVSQDFADFGPFTLPVHLHSEAKVSIVGRTIVDVFQRDYQVVPGAAQVARAAGSE